MASKRPAPAREPRNVAQIARQELLQRLGAQWPVGRWLPPVPELARALGVGHVSAHRAVKALTREGYLLPLRGKGTRVLRAATQASVAEPSSRATRHDAQTAGGATRHRIAIVRSRQTDPMIHRMIDAFMEAAHPLHPHFEFVLTDGLSDDWQLPAEVDGSVVFNQLPPRGKPKRGSAMPHVVFVSTSVTRPQVQALQADVVTIDQHEAGRLAGACLRDAGCDTVCFIGRRLDSTGAFDATSQARLAGFEAGWGAALSDEFLMYGRYYGPKTGEHGFLRWMQLSPRPQGIFAASDELAMGILSAAVLEGLRPGIDFHLVGVDGQERARNATGFPLTSVQMPADAMGRQAARMLRQRLLDGETQPMRVVLGCSLYEGRTVQRAKTVLRRNLKTRISCAAQSVQEKA